MGATVTTHVLDTARGSPAEGVLVGLFTIDDGRRRHVTTATTNADGRTAAPLATDHGRIDAAGRHAVALAGGDPDIAFVMAEIEIGLSPVIGDEDLPVLIGAHRAGIDIEVGVELAQAHLEAARLQQRAERRR